MVASTMKERGVSLVLSLAFHVVLLLFLIKVVPPVRGYKYRKVADVRIVSPEKLFISRFDGFVGDIQAAVHLTQELLPQDTSVQMPEGPPQVIPDPGVIYLRNLSFGRDLSEIAAGSDFYEAVPRLDLVPSPKSKGGFSLRIGGGEKETEDSVEEKTQKPPFFANPGSSPLTSLEFNRVVTNKKLGVSSSESAQEMFVQQGGYDLTPWVRDVVDKIRNNWTLPPIDESIAMGEVKIFIIIGKKGDLVALEIVQASDFKAFELTTLGAVRASLPFPPLPDDYDNDRIEAYLVFQFHE